MTHKKLVTFAILTITLILTACGPAPELIPTRQEQLAESNIFGRYKIDGVAVDQSIEGYISGGFFLFAGDVDGKISSSTNYIIDWYQTGTTKSTTIIPRLLIKVNLVENLENPEIEFKFKQSWREGTVGYYENIDKLSLEGTPNAYLYTEGSKQNPNNFIKTENLDVVNIYISPKDLVIPEE